MALDYIYLLDHRIDEGINAWTERFITAVGTAVSDFAGVPLYVADFDDMTTVNGFSVPGLAATLESDIRQAGKWTGRGVCVGINAKARYRESYELAKKIPLPDRAADRFARCAQVGVVLHELAHCLEGDDFGQDDPIGRDANVSRQALLKYISEGPSKATQLSIEATGISPPWKKHDAQWVRAVCHLASRMKRFLPELCQNNCAFLPMYELSDIQDYTVALAPELRTSTGSIRKILAARPPEPYIDLWRADIKKWFASIPTTPNNEQTAIALEALALYSK